MTVQTALIEKIKSLATLEEAEKVLADSPSGHFDYFRHRMKVRDLVIWGNFQLYELEAALVHSLYNVIEPAFVQDFGIDFSSKRTSDGSVNPHLVELNELYGLTPEDAVLYRQFMDENIDIIGMSSERGGYVTLGRCSNVTALQCVIVEMIYFCKRRDVEPLTLVKYLEQQKKAKEQQ